MSPAHYLVFAEDPSRRDELVNLLRAAGHHAAAAPDGAAASAAIGVPGFDVLVLDLTLPELDLAALRQAIRPAEPATPDSLDAAERRHIALVLRYTGGNKRKAAHLLGISRSTLLHKVRKYGLMIIAAAALCSARGFAQQGAAADSQARAATDSIPAQEPAQARDSRPIPAADVLSGTLSFDGHATVGDFVGKTTTVSGALTGGTGLAAVRGWVEAPVSSLRTGNGKRDKDLNKSMESSRYPALRFDLSDVTPAPAGRATGNADSVHAQLHGTLTLHGVRRDVQLPAVIVFQGSDVRVRSDFPVNVKDYRVGGLSKLLGVLKMDEHIEVHVDVTFRSKP